jgi:hypothetical protein
LADPPSRRRAGGGGTTSRPAVRLIGRRLDRSHSAEERPAGERRERAMIACRHTRIRSCDQLDGDMHCTGCRCLECEQEITGECHHRTRCRLDFCGTQPTRPEAYAVRG